jgi:hypothetical protein
LYKGFIPMYFNIYMVDTAEKIRELEKKLDELYDVLLAIKLKLETYRKNIEEYKRSYIKDRIYMEKRYEEVKELLDRYLSLKNG